MRLKSFYGSTLTEAMRQVREALGEDAIIVATRDDDMGGVRVTAAIEDAAPVKAPPPAVAQADDDFIELLADRLHRQGVAPSLAEQCLATAIHYASDDPVLALAAAFDAHLKFRTAQDSKPLMMIGPPGAGKTLCTAKLATAACLKKKPSNVITTDTVRAGGIDQLAAFTRLLKLDLLEIEDPHALRDVLASQGGKPAFIDTAGCNPFDREERQAMAELVKAANADTLLVLPAGLEAQEGADLAEAFRTLGATGLILTRLDMTRRLGSALSIAQSSHLPLVYAGHSPSVTQNLEPLTPVALARLILPDQVKAQTQPQKSAGFPAR